jgi:hypothetical protein
VSTAHTNGRPAAPPAEGGASLADVIAAEAQAIRARRDPVASLMADELDRLAQLVTFTGATTPGDYRARLAVLEESRDEDQIRRAYAQGFDHGFQDGRDKGLQEAILVIKTSAFRR